MVEWSTLFSVSVSPLELIVRGSAIYWFLFLLFRFVLRRDVGSIAIADVLLLVLIADASQNAMAGGYETVTDGFILVGTIAGWNYALDWLAFRFPALRNKLEPPPMALIRNGRLLRANLRREMVTIEELNAQLRQQGIEEHADIKLAVMESDGSVSVIRRESAVGEGPKRERRVP